MLTSRTPKIVAGTALALAFTLAGCSSGQSTGASGSKGKTITVWSLENQADRVNTTKQIIAGFTKKTGIAVKLVAVDENQLGQLVASNAMSGSLPDVMGALSLSDVRQLNQQKLLNTDATASVVKDLGEGTFAKSALTLDSDQGKQLAVPDSAFAQILLYRKDLFAKAGLQPPTTYDAIEKAAQTLTSGGTSGITLATDPADVFTEQTFESLALGNNCQLVGNDAKIGIDSSACQQTWDLYGKLAQKYSPSGTQTVDTTRATYFAGKAAMVDWSTYILDELGGLRNDALPTCPQCRTDKTWLAKNTGIVTNIAGPSGSPSTFGEITGWSILKKANAPAAQQFVKYMMSDGYLGWLGMAPEGKVPVRSGTATEPTKFSDGWKTLKTGVDTKASLSSIYDAATMKAIEDAPAQINRWAIPEGQGSLLGTVNTQLVLPKVIAALGAGSLDPASAAKQAADAVAQVQSKQK